MSSVIDKNKNNVKNEPDKKEDKKVNDVTAA